MRITIKLLPFPLTLTLGIIVALSRFACHVSGAVLGIVSSIATVIAVLALVLLHDPKAVLNAGVIAFAISPFRVPMLAEWVVDRLDDVPAHLLTGDSITEIHTAEGLQTFRDDVNNGNSYSGETVMLMDDIDLSSIVNWTPIGDVPYGFNGTFDGGGKTITGLTITGGGSQGLFGGISGTVKNLTLQDVSVSGTNNVGGVAGSSSGSVTGCTVTGSVSGTDYYVGGVAGRVAVGGSVTDCAALNPSVTGVSDTGRVAGENDDSFDNLDNNVAWAGMDIKVNGSAKDPLDEGYDRVNGHGLSMEEIEDQYEDIFDQGDFHLRRTGISGAVVALNPTSHTYDGGAKTPDITVTLNGTALTEGTDYAYTVTSVDGAGTSEGTNAGTVTLTIDANGYLRFQTEYAGEIIIAEGELEKR